MRRKRWILSVWLLLFLAATGPALAADLSMHSSLQYFWYTDPFQDDDQSDLILYTKVGARELGPEKRFSVNGYGRISQQFGGGDNRFLGEDDGILGRLYFLHVDYALPADRGLVQLGRQWITVSAETETIDGVRVVVRPYGPLVASVFGGYTVRFAETSDQVSSDDYLLGASLGATILERAQVEGSYARRWDESDVVREMLGFQAQARLPVFFTLYTDWRYDILHDDTSEFTAGVRVFPPFPANVTVTGEYYFAYPNFDADTVYTAFAITEVEEYVLRADYVVNPQLSLHGSYAFDHYDGDDAHVATLGAAVRPAKVAGLGVSGSVHVRSGFPGDLTGFMLTADYALGKGLVAAGITYDVFERDSMADEFEAKRYWAGGSYEFLKNMTARLRIEDTVTRQYSNEFQGRAAVDVRF